MERKVVAMVVAVVLTFMWGIYFPQVVSAATYGQLDSHVEQRKQSTGDSGGLISLRNGERNDLSSTNQREQTGDGVRLQQVIDVDREWATHAHDNVVETGLSEAESNVLVYDRLDGKLMQYAVSDKVGFVNMLKSYVDDCMFIFVDSRRGATGFEYALHKYEALLINSNSSYSVEFVNLTDEHFSKEELSVIVKYLRDSYFGVVQVTRKAIPRELRNGQWVNTAAPTVTVRTTSRANDTAQTISTYLGLFNQLDSAKNILQKWGLF